MAALGGAALVPAASASVLRDVARLTEDEARDSRSLVDQQTQPRIDPSKVVMLADIHICGEFENGQSKYYPYNPTCLRLRIEEILAMRPLPANVMVFGDVAWDYGLEDDYRYAAQLLKPLEQAGIKLTLGLGNHDRRAAFFNTFPDYATHTPVKGRAVTVVSLHDVDFVMLDSLAELPNLKPRQGTTVGGEMDDEQIAWLSDFLAKSKRPVLLGAHHPLGEMPNLESVIAKSPAVAGYIYGHTHIWNKSTRIIRPRDPQRMIPTVGLPATFYGDIGLAVMHTSAEGAKVEYSSSGFWWPQPVENPPKEWAQRVADLSDERCTILFK